MTDKSILIIGAGVSGIAATTRLLENGYKNVQVLEAESRIGGRVYTTPFGSSVVDIGAQWCHGQENNTVHDLVKDYNILHSDLEKFETINFKLSNGETVDVKKSNKLFQLLTTLEDKHEDELEKYNGTLGSFITSK